VDSVPRGACALGRIAAVAFARRIAHAWRESRGSRVFRGYRGFRAMNALLVPVDIADQVAAA